MFTEELSKQVKERTIVLRRSNEDMQQFAVRKIKTFNNRVLDEFSKVLPEKVNFYI